jgi:hypothetical protein
MRPKIVSSVTSETIDGDSATVRDPAPDGSTREEIEKRVVTDVLMKNDASCTNIETEI